MGKQNTSHTPQNLEHFFVCLFLNTWLFQWNRARKRGEVTAFRGDLWNDQARHVQISQRLIDGHSMSDFPSSSIICWGKKSNFLADFDNLMWIPGLVLRYNIWLAYSRILYYWLAAFSDHVQKVLRSPFNDILITTFLSFPLPTYIHSLPRYSFLIQCTN